MKTYTIHFIRHGMTEANLKGQYVGATDLSVCSEGVAKLKELKNKFNYPSTQEHYVSPLSRCVETCNIIYPDAKPIITPGLAEANFGDWEGKTAAELADIPQYHEWVSGGRMTAPPHGERGTDFYNRICKTIEDTVYSMASRDVTSSTMITHGGVIMMILSRYGLPKAEFFEWVADNGCGYSVRITPSLWQRDKVFEVYEKLPRGANGQVSGEFKNLIDSIKDQK